MALWVSRTQSVSLCEYISPSNLYIVDPKKHIRSSKDTPPPIRSDYVDAITKSTVISSSDIAMLICDFAECGYTLAQVDCRKNIDTKGRWADVHCEGYGVQMWFPNGRAYPGQIQEWAINAPEWVLTSSEIANDRTNTDEDIEMPSRPKKRQRTE